MAGQRNWFLLAGVSLPAVLLLGFFGYTWLARGVVEPPAHDLFFSTFLNRAGTEPQHATVHFSIVDERIVVRATPAPGGGVYWNQGLFRLDGGTLTATSIDIEVPVEFDPRGVEVAVPALAGIRVSADTTAPDGYRFRSGYERGPGLIGEIFYRDRGRAFTIEKLGIVHRIEAPDGDWSYGQAQFLGWVLADE